MILCTSVLLVGWTYQVIADSYTVTATVPAPPLNQGAVITAPSDGTTVTVAAIQVSGTCPSGSYIKLYTNSTFSGVTFCENNGTFSLPDDLYVGENNLLAQDYNVTDDPGPVTPSVMVDYVPQTPPVTNSGGGNVTITQSNGATNLSVTPTPNASPTAIPALLLTSNYAYRTSLVSSNFTWMVDVEGGVPPYTVTIYWGDGSTSRLVFNSDPVFQISHHYKTAGYYAIKIQAVDKIGNVRFIYLAARIVTPNTTGNMSTADTGFSMPFVGQNRTSSLLAHSASWLWLAWPSLLIVLIMLISFWLGERQELRVLYKHRRL